jgi:CheY-like chemotaxis protein
MTGTICGKAARDTPPGRNHDATTVLVADALPILRAGVQELLTREGDFDVVEAEDLDELAQVAAQHAMIVDPDRSPEADTIVAAANRFGRGL